MNGNRLFADHGLLVRRFQVDTLGDDALWNDQFIDGSFELIQETGNHPFFFFTGDFCDIVRDLLGDGAGATPARSVSRLDLAPFTRMGRAPYRAR
jgi:hypothetical protein